MFNYTKSLLIVFIFIVLPSLLYSTVINIPADYATIQEGIDASVNTDTVLVQPGTYVENINYNGKRITLGSLFLTTQDTTYISSTIIDGNDNGSVVTFNNGEDSTAVLCGFTITNGYREEGGGIICLNDSSPSLQNLIITDNDSYYSGGGIYCGGSNPSFNNVIISDNYSYYDGGGIYCASSSPSLENVIITNNVSYNGGGIICDNASPSFKNVSITNNIVEWGGGGIYCMSNSNLNLENVTIAYNNAYYNNGDGIYCQTSTLTLTNSIMWNNTSNEISLSSGGVVTMTYSDIEGGWAGIGNIDSDPLFVDAANGNFHLTETSPCIDAGDPVSPLDPDNTIADMGAYYFHQVVSLDSPENVTIEIVGTDVNISWDQVTNANSYIVHSSDDPYSGFVVDTSGSFTGESWRTSIGNMKKFYYVIASTETEKANL